MGAKEKREIEEAMAEKVKQVEILEVKINEASEQKLKSRALISRLRKKIAALVSRYKKRDIWVKRRELELVQKKRKLSQMEEKMRRKNKEISDKEAKNNEASALRMKDIKDKVEQNKFIASLQDDLYKEKNMTRQLKEQLEK